MPQTAALAHQSNHSKHQSHLQHVVARHVLWRGPDWHLGVVDDQADLRGQESESRPHMSEAKGRLVGRVLIKGRAQERRACWRAGVLAGAAAGRPHECTRTHTSHTRHIRTLLQGPIGSSDTPRAIRAAASSRRRALSELTRSVICGAGCDVCGIPWID